MTPGSIVTYHPRPGEPSYPAIVLSQWPDGSVQLYAFHFEAAHHVRMAHPSEVTESYSPEQMVEALAAMDQHEQRLNLIEEALLQMQPVMHKLLGHMPETAPSSDAGVDSTPTDSAPAESTEPPSKAKTRWPAKAS